MTIQRDIYVLKDVLKTPIEVVEGTDAVTIEFYVRDFDIPATAAAVVYSIGSGVDEPNKTLADVDGNKISITPTASFFAPGKNTLQIRIISETKRLITFQETVKCKSKMKFSDDQEENQQTLVEQLLSAVGKECGERKSADEKECQARENADQNEAKERENADKKLDEKIETIKKEMLTIGTASLNTEFSNDTCLQKNGKTVTLNTNINPGFTSKVAEWWGIATLPTGYRPKQKILCTALGYQGGWSDPTVVAGMIETGGTIYIYSQNSKLTNFSISTSWMAD